MIIKHITNFAIAMALSQTLSAETNYFEAGKETLADLIEIESTESARLATKASEYALEKLRSAGFGEDDLQIAGPTATTLGLAATLRGAGSGPPVSHGASRCCSCRYRILGYRSLSNGGKRWLFVWQRNQ